tara:strand:+ start:107 stop:628 length:522 start_codon:yes stop_codon:yes gene_type:complete
MNTTTAVKPPQRASILLRPKTKASRNNVESADAQYELDQQRIESARGKRELLDAERMRWHGSARGDPDDKALVQETVQCDMRIHAAARDEAAQHEELLSSHVKATVAMRADLEKDLEERQSDARRGLQNSVMLENRALADAKFDKLRHEKAQELEQDLANLELFNERWGSTPR